MATKNPSRIGRKYKSKKEGLTMARQPKEKETKALPLGNRSWILPAGSETWTV